MVTPCLMYMFMSLTALSLFALIENFVAQVIIGIVCILFGAAFNAHLLYNCGKIHYDSYVTGYLHRQNELFGVPSGGDHRAEKEYRPWKGFFIGFLVSVPAIVFACLGAIPAAKAVFMIFISLITFWSYIPAWLTSFYHQTVLGIEGYTLSTLWCLPMTVLPVLVSGVFYIIGAYVNKHNRETGKFPQPPAEKKKKK